MKKYPVGIQSFEVIRSDNYYYVDKTGFVKKLSESAIELREELKNFILLSRIWTAILNLYSLQESQGSAR